MTPRRAWHLDLKFPSSLFGEAWDDLSTSSLIKLFKYVDQSDGIVLSTLPPGVGPAGAAVAAAMHFLPELADPPKPFCRIALYPGSHFVRQIRQFGFKASALNSTLAAARKRRAEAELGALKLHGPVFRLNKVLNKAATSGEQAVRDEEIFFHWIFKCHEIWWQNGIRFIEMTPRGHYGRDDEYGPAIDFITGAQRLSRFRDKYNPYDLLVYCPNFHSRDVGSDIDQIQAIAKEVTEFSAHRKLVLVKTPYNFWSRQMEKALKVPGVALPSIRRPAGGEGRDGRTKIEIKILNQLISTEEAFVLDRQIESLARGGAESNLIADIRSACRRLFVSLDPIGSSEGEDASTVVSRLGSLLNALGVSRDSECLKILEALHERIRQPELSAKLRYIADRAQNGVIEVWVTKDPDRAVLRGIEPAHPNMKITLADRWMIANRTVEDPPVILSRIDRENDMDLVPYLRTGDTILVSTWEAVVRRSPLLKAWERSDRWRDHASKLGIFTLPEGQASDDGVLDLADRLDTIYQNHVSARSIAEIPGDVELESWWDQDDARSTLDSSLSRKAMLAVDVGAPLRKGREIRFEDGSGIFLGVEDIVQVMVNFNEENEIDSMRAEALMSGMSILLFKDSERSSIFDILMDQLERSSEYATDAKTVRDWKTALRIHFHSKGVKIQEVAKRMTEARFPVEPITVRSWVFGSTMAPLRKENLVAFINEIGINNIDANKLFKSVKRIRTISMSLGRGLNQAIMSRDIDDLDGRTREVLASAGVDVQELSAAVEIRKISSVSAEIVDIDARNLRKIFASEN